MEDQLQCMEFTVTEDMEEERIDKLLSSLFRVLIFRNF